MSTEEKKHILAAKFNLAPNSINVRKVNWEKILREMVVVDIRVSYWRAKAALDFSDLGLSAQAQSDLVAIGHRRLLPVIPPESKFFDDGKPRRTYIDLLNAAEKKVRSSTDKYAFGSPVGKCMTPENYESWHDEFAVGKAEIEEISAELISKWAENRELVLEEYSRFAANSWLTMQRLTDEQLSEKGKQTKDEFVNEFLLRVRSEIPTVEEYKRRFYCDYSLSYLPLSDILAEEKAIAERIGAQADMDRRERAVALAELSSREQVVAKIRTEVFEQEKKRIVATAKKVAESFSVQVRERILQVVTDLKRSMNENDGKLLGRNSLSLNNLLKEIERVTETLDLANDEEISAIVKVLKDAKKGEAFQARLDDVVNTLKATILAIQTPDRYITGEELAVVVPPSELIRSRMELGLKTSIRSSQAFEERSE